MALLTYILLLQLWEMSFDNPVAFLLRIYALCWAWSKGRGGRDHTSGVIWHLLKAIMYSSVFVSWEVSFCLLKPQDGPVPPMELCKRAAGREKEMGSFPLSSCRKCCVYIFLVLGNYISSFTYNLSWLLSVSYLLNFEYLNIKEFLLR